jgi:hypothetical protein
MQTTEVLTEDELTPTNLKKFFESIYLKASLNDHGYLLVQADGVLPIMITLDQERKLLKFLLAYDNGHGQLTLKHINRLNDSYILARFSVSEQGDRNVSIVLRHLFVEFSVAIICLKISFQAD